MYMFDYGFSFYSSFVAKLTDYFNVDGTDFTISVNFFDFNLPLVLIKL
jgi:hypothetical protein